MTDLNLSNEMVTISEHYQTLFVEEELSILRDVQKNDFPDLFLYLETPICNYFSSEDLTIIDNLQNRYKVRFADYQETIRLFHRRQKSYVKALKEFCVTGDYDDLYEAFFAMKNITLDLIGIIKFFREKHENPKSKGTFVPDWKIRRKEAAKRKEHYEEEDDDGDDPNGIVSEKETFESQEIEEIEEGSDVSERFSTFTQREEEEDSFPLFELDEEREQEKIAFKRSFSTTGFTPDNYQLMEEAADLYIYKLSEGLDHFLAFDEAMEFYDYWAYYNGGDE